MKETLICSGNQTAPFVHRFEFSHIISEKEKGKSETRGQQEVMEPQLNAYGASCCSPWKNSTYRPPSSSSSSNNMSSRAVKVLGTRILPREISPRSNLSPKSNLSAQIKRCKDCEKTTSNAEATPDVSTSSTSSCLAKVPQHLTVSSSSSLNEGRINDSLRSIDCDHEKDTIKTLIYNLSVTAINGQLMMINLSRRGLSWLHSTAIRNAMSTNPHLSVLKLSYNNLGDRGTAIVAAGFIMPDNTKHPSLTALDLGFNAIGDAGCAALTLHAVAGNFNLSTLFLSGNHIKQKGAMAIGGAILHGCSLSELHLSANRIGEVGVQALARAIAERELLVTSGERQHKTMQKLHLIGIEMGREGAITLSRMLLNNYSIRTLCISSNGIDDNDLALLSQSISRNKNVPLEVINLSFNEITCTGIECFMNAIWGSQTLKEIRVDNNKIKDRGAQLAAVVLTSVKLEVIDLSFNKITTLGIKALMKSLSENSSLQYLGLSGIQIDPNAAKALSYGLAYNATLKSLHIDNCAIGYAAQRHIIAGVVSNRLASLRILTGFQIGAIATTLGLPQNLENWTNDQCLSFVHQMWKQWREENGISDRNAATKGITDKLIGPAPPPVVKRAADMMMQIRGTDSAKSLNTEDHQKDVSETSPLVHSNDTMLERSESGTLRVPSIAQNDAKVDIEGWSPKKVSSSVQRNDVKVDLEQKNRNLLWLRSHFQSLHQVGQLPFNEADLWQLHQYFFSPVVCAPDSEESQTHQEVEHERDESQALASGEPLCRSDLREHRSETHLRGSFERAVSFQRLADATNTSLTGTSLNGEEASNHTRRRTLETMEGAVDDDSIIPEEFQPACKRAKNFIPRIAYYPRIRQVLESVVNKQSPIQILSLLRQLKFVENVMFKGRNVYADNEEVKETDQSTPADVEMIILDLL
mmetsp:Transcript_30277/g.46218  ORF Transcript_30277/g.46218 Transcript_30277/m.46218 type:complete len:923 (-) Transcript_30277:375-3143(-)